MSPAWTRSYGSVQMRDQSLCRVSLLGSQLICIKTRHVLHPQLCCLGHLTALRSLTVVAEINTASGVDFTGLPAGLEELTLVTPWGLWLSAAPAHGCQARRTCCVCSSLMLLDVFVSSSLPGPLLRRGCRLA